MKHWNIRIEGDVQGVCFRACACDEAQRLGLGGFVRNEPDGSVYAEAEGETAALEAFLAWCHRGPPAARVEQVRVTGAARHGFTGFTIRH